MYNIYIHEKQLSDYEKASNEKKNFLKIENKRKKKINSLTKNYNNRMKKFVLNLCESPVILGQNENETFSNTQDPFNNNENENAPRKYLVFGKYISDKKKIEIINQEKSILDKYEEINKQTQHKRDLLKARNNNNIILLQPRMKFGPREEIENIVETMNKNGSNINKKYNKILNDHLKKLKDYNARYVKRYDILKNHYGNNYDNIKNYITKLNYQENEYSYKKVIASKLSNNINDEYLDRKNALLEYKKTENNDNTKNDSTTKKITSQNNINYNIKSNELKRLFNDNRKLYFKGASQFISLKLVKPKIKKNHNSTDDIQENEITVIYTDKNIYFKKGNNLMNKNNNNKNKNNKKLEKQEPIPQINHNNKKPKINMNIFTPTSQNEKAHERYLNKYIDLDNPIKSNKMNNSPLLDDNYEENPKGLCEESKIKKIKMNHLMNKEINKSIVNNYMDKYDIINQFNKNNTINTNSLYFQGYNRHISDRSDENLSEKLKYLIKEIQKRNKELKRENTNLASYMTSTSHFKISNKKEKKKIKNVASNDYILIDGHFISKNDIKALSDAIFTKCKFYKKKKTQSQRNIINNNEKFRKMAGLTASNFYSKMGN